MKNVILFGYGKMGSSIAKGWKSTNIDFNFFIIETDISLKNKAVSDGFNSFHDIKQLLSIKNIKSLDIIFLAVKPQQMSLVIKQIQEFDNQNTLFISIAAGLSFGWFQKNLYKNIKIIRAMPNTPASVRRGVTGYCKSNNVTELEKNEAHKLLSSIGKAIFLNSESLIDVVTSISGSGPAYIFYLVEVLTEIGITEGLDEKDAKLIALETLIGSAKLLDITNIDPKILRNNVTSPGGTTEAALEILTSSKSGLLPLLKSTIKFAKKRAEDLNSNN
tara:strand:+ start:116 stop:940 length:825 start_codon:yes stop_codon:yes gene_type:complete